MNEIPRWIRSLLLTLGVLALIPPALILRARFSTAREPRIHLWPDMDNQPRYKAQMTHPLFADGRASRLPVAGTVARGEPLDARHFLEGRAGDGWATAFPELNPYNGAPLVIDMPFLERGRERYEIFCAPCHGLDGYGQGMIAQRAAGVSGATWTIPTSLHDGGPDSPRSRELGHLFNTITNGIRNMPAYGPQIPAEDRWAIVAYLKALQLSQNAP